MDPTTLERRLMAALVLVSELPGSGGGLALAAGCAVAIAREAAAGGGEAGDAILLVEVGGGRGRGPTMLAAEAARELEGQLRESGFECAARGRLAWLRIAPDPGWPEALAEAL